MGEPPYCIHGQQPRAHAAEAHCGFIELTCGIRTRSPTATLIGTRLPSLSSPPGPTASTFASLSFSTLDSGRKMPPAVLVSALTRWTRIRSRRGARDLMERIAVAYARTGVSKERVGGDEAGRKSSATGVAKASISRASKRKLAYHYELIEVEKVTVTRMQADAIRFKAWGRRLESRSSRNFLHIALFPFW